MDSPVTFSYGLDRRPNQDFSCWVLSFKGVDILSRQTLLPDGDSFSLPDETTEAFRASASLSEPMNHNAIVEIVSGLQNADAAGVSTRNASSYSGEFFLITAHFRMFGVPKELYTEVLKEISDYVRRNPRVTGGAIEVEVWRVRSETVQLDEDPEVDAYVESMFPGILSSREPVPADSSAIDSLGTVRFTRECAICVQDFAEGSMITRLPCDHTFHGDCIKTWLQINRECPLCRKPVC
ncbi:PREDICTED: E3 ubiquitin ligase BIG BROTHER-related-like [Tarenaya hassleriana]|uniref:E3 ubiquitin ligase BIG BROTHER-related-like n=1 Tax=Tarenaya hassleriana TaxID=28532 RepID=UPI00053C8388|nr:PREDICTED: E3 ubiquitin ligase BIG BROTHER-related-like [Tarenaya hassleriana]